MLFPFQFGKELLEVFWRIDFLSRAEIEEMLQSEVDSKRVLLRYLIAELGAFLVRMDNEGDKILSTCVFGNCGRADLPGLDLSRKNEFQTVVTFLCLYELRNLDLLVLEIYFEIGGDFKRLMVVKFAFKPRESPLMSEEFLECLVKMRDRVL